MSKIKILVTMLFSIIIVMSALAFQAKGICPPKKVKEAFAVIFPKVKKVLWEKEADAHWEAEFKMKGKNISSLL